MDDRSLKVGIVGYGHLGEFSSKRTSLNLHIKYIILLLPSFHFYSLHLLLLFLNITYVGPQFMSIELSEFK